MNERNRNQIVSRIAQNEESIDSINMHMWVIRGFIFYLLLKQWGAF